MTTGYASAPPDGSVPAPMLRLIESEVAKGLPNEAARLDEAAKNLEFYQGNFKRFPPRPPGQQYDAERYIRTSRVMNRIVKVLTKNLYKHGPARRLPDYPQADKWLDNLYRRHLIDALWQQADRLSTVSDVVAWEARGWSDPDCPVKLQLWDASTFCAYVHPDDPTKPIVVATRDMFDNQRRIRLWTSTELQTWLTEKVAPNQTSGGTTYTHVTTEPNVYGRLPFTFAHWEFPTCDFWSGGPGTHLTDVNDGINFFLTEQFDCIRYNLRPVIKLRGVEAGWRPPMPVKPGDMWDLPSAPLDATGAAPPADASFLQADTGFIGAGLDDLNAFLDHTLEMNGVPPAAIRMEQTSARSGISIVCEQVELIDWAQSRQRPFARFEDDLAKLVLTVGARHLENNGVANRELAKAAEDPGLVLHWPGMWPDIPGPERDQGDQWDMENGFASRTTVLMRRENLTREEAEERLEQIAEDVKRERKLFGESDPAQAEAAALALAQAKAKAAGAMNESDENDDDLMETDDVE